MTEYILTMGYYPDRFVVHDMPPDIFFIHIFGNGDRDWITVEHSIPLLVQSCIEKYKLTYEPWNIRGFAAFNWADTFWSVSPKGDRNE